MPSRHPESPTIPQDSANLVAELTKFSELKRAMKIDGDRSGTVSFRIPSGTAEMFDALAKHYELTKTEVLILLVRSAHKEVFGSPSSTTP